MKRHGANALRHINEGAVGENCGVKPGKVVISVGHNGTEILFDQFRVFAHRF